MSLRIGDTAPDFEAETTSGSIRFHDWLGNSWGVALLPSQGLHARLHDGARLHGQAQARVRQAQRQGHRAERRPGGLPLQVVGRHQGDAGLRAELSDDRRPGAEGREGLGNASRRARAHVAGPHRGRQPDRPQRLRRRPRQEDQADPRLPDDDRPQLRRSPARDRFAAADREAQGRDAGELEAAARTSSSPARSPTKTRRSSTRPAGRRPSRISGSFRSRGRGRNEGSISQIRAGAARPISGDRAASPYPIALTPVRPPSPRRASPCLPSTRPRRAS